MNERLFEAVAARPENPLWEKYIRREKALYVRTDEIRSPFARDYTRILHSTAYRRLKHKTQVFFNINNDHICTRMEHVAHVESVSSSIARALGLNAELTQAIATGHDLGHAPFGHQGEKVIDELSKKYLGKPFWHEKNGLRIVDKLELLEDNYSVPRNLDLTFAVRDGILSHCGELDKNGLFPREIDVPLETFDAPGKYEAASWEGCVVKIADKIAYVGRDIEDADSLGFLDQNDKHILLQMARARDERVMNTTVIMHNMILDICNNSSPENGIRMSGELHAQLTELKTFNYRHIYHHPRLQPFVKYSELVLHQIFETLRGFYDGKHTFACIEKNGGFTPNLSGSFADFLARYCDPVIVPEGTMRETTLHCENEKLYGTLECETDYLQAVVDFMSGMTDRFAIELFRELLEY